jgi:AraC-like DNA-binding protein
MSSVLPEERVNAWKPSVPGITEVFHARFREHAYPPHVHDTWTLFLVDGGAIRYDLDRHHLGARGPVVSILPPYVVHDGRPADGRGYHKRVLYLATSVLSERLAGRAVDQPSFDDLPLRRTIDRLHELLRHPDDAFEAEGLLAVVAARVQEHLTGLEEPPEPVEPSVAQELRAYLEEHAFERVTLRAAGAHLGASSAHLVRSFTRTFGIAPHAYLVSRRVEAARPRLLDGEPIARVAADLGFFDQAHLTRHFRRHVGTTPGRYASCSAD